ncbi:MAG TPA: surface-adhesin E family protein [Thermodesulfobacteriota bacterium]|nr:surface-adhesin E family protein [Thermodesulfobacteriota bacterium]
MVKKFFIFCTLLITFFILASGVRAENWVNVATAKDDSVKAYVDEDSITVEGNKRKFWMYHDFKGAQSADGKPIEKAYGHSVVNCEAKTIGYMETIIEWADGSKKKSREKLQEEPVKPGSIDAAILNYVCQYKKQG